MLPADVGGLVKVCSSSDRRASSNSLARHPACVIVAPTCDLMSSPTIGTPASVNLAAQTGSEAMKTCSALTKATLASIAHWA